MAMDYEKWREQRDQMMAGHEIMWARHEQMLAQHHETMARIDRRLDRAIRLGVQDARRYRKRNLEIQETMAQIAATHEQLLRSWNAAGMGSI